MLSYQAEPQRSCVAAADATEPCFLLRVVMQRQDARIIVGLFYETEARKVFCEVSIFPPLASTPGGRICLPISRN